MIVGISYLITRSGDIILWILTFNSGYVKRQHICHPLWAHGVGKSVTFIDGYGVGDTITRVDNDTGGSSWGVKGEHSLNSNIEAGNVERFKYYLGHLLSVGLRVHGSFSEEDWVLFREDSELAEESMMPDSFHVFPVVDNTVFNWVQLSKSIWAIASSPTYASLLSIPTNSYTNILALPTMAGKQHLGASSPAIPALHYPDPLSMTTAASWAIFK